jgi:regulator of nucleoside diphosphate kinase
MSRSTGIFLTEPDAARLERSIIKALLRSPAAAQDAVELEAILDEAAVVPSAALDPQVVVTMNAVVVLEDSQSGRRTTVTLVYPRQADPACRRISVLSPFGRALLGARVGDVIKLSASVNASSRFVVAELPFQPEAAERFDR